MQQRFTKKGSRSKNKLKSLDDAKVYEFIVANADELKQKSPHHKPNKLWLIRIVVCVL